MATIGIFEAKTRLSELVRLVGEGERFTITVRGEAKADLVPRQAKDRQAVADAVRELKAMPKITGVSPETIREWIEDGRE